MEKAVRADIRKTKLQSAVIASIAAAGMLAVAALAPNAFRLLGVGRRTVGRTQGIGQALARLVERGYVRVEVKDGEQSVCLTDKGERFAAQMGEGRFALKRQREWDGKWRMLIFDIPESRSRSRQQLRRTLVGLGFCRLQDSVWVFPHNCEDLVALLKIDFRVGKDLLYVIADRIENDASLRKHFNI